MVKTYQEKQAYNKMMYHTRYKLWNNGTLIKPAVNHQLTFKPKPKAEKKAPKPESPKSKSKYFGGDT